MCDWIGVEAVVSRDYFGEVTTAAKLQQREIAALSMKFFSELGLYVGPKKQQ